MTEQWVTTQRDGRIYMQDCGHRAGILGNRVTTTRTSMWVTCTECGQQEMGAGVPRVLGRTYSSDDPIGHGPLWLPSCEPRPVR